MGEKGQGPAHEKLLNSNGFSSRWTRTAAAPKGHRAFLCPRGFPSPSTGSISIPVPGCTKSSTFKARWLGSGPVWEDEWDGSSGVPTNAMVFVV